MDRQFKQCRRANISLRFLVAAFILLTSSVNLNAQWVQTNGPYVSVIYTLATSGTNVVAGTLGGGVFLSKDSGASWTQTPLTNTWVHCLYDNNAKLFAGTDSGVFLSNNNGSGWTSINSGLSNTSIMSFASIGGNLVAGTFAGGAFLSTNNGMSWTAADSGMGDMTTVDCFAVHGQNLFAGTAQHGVLKSTDNGASWEQTSLANIWVDCLAATDTCLYAGAYLFGRGMFRSNDDGASWALIDSGLTNTNIQAIAVHGTELLVGTSGGGVFRSTNNGAAWATANSGLWDAQALAFAWQGTSLFAGTSSGIFLSTSNGSTWTPITSGFERCRISAVATLGTKLFVECFDGVHVSTDNGASWSRMNSVHAPRYVNVFKTDGTKLYAGGSGIYVSTNAGMSWAETDSGLRENTYSLAVDEPNIFAGTGNGVYRSTNDGISWSPSNNGLPIGFPKYNSTSINSIVSNGNSLLVGVSANSDFSSTQGVFRSIDSGSTWIVVDSALQNITTNCLLVNGSNIFAGTSKGVFVSADNGTSWTLVDSGLTDLTVDCLVAEGSNIFAGTRNSGIFLSTNNGSVWSPVNTGMSNTSILSLDINGTYLFAGAETGLWRRPLSELTLVEKSSITSPTDFNLDQNYPNPFNPSTTIRFSIPERSRVRVRIFNLLGQRVTELADEEMNAGNFEKTWNANVASGLYFYRLEAVSVNNPGKRFVDVKKMMLLK